MIWFTTSLLKNSKVLNDMHDDNAGTVRLHQETFCNNGGKEAWYGIFELQ